MQINGVLKPESVVVGQNVGYTVPVGKVSKLTIVLSTGNIGYQSANALNSLPSSEPKTTATANSQTVNLTLRAGDVVSSTRTTGSGNTGAGFSGTDFRTSEASTVLLINAVACCVVRSPIVAQTRNFAGGGTTTLTTTGTADIGFIAEEYFE